MEEVLYVSPRLDVYQSVCGDLLLSFIHGLRDDVSEGAFRAGDYRHLCAVPLAHRRHSASQTWLSLSNCGGQSLPAAGRALLNIQRDRQRVGGWIRWRTAYPQHIEMRGDDGYFDERLGVGAGRSDRTGGKEPEQMVVGLACHRYPVDLSVDCHPAIPSQLDYTRRRHHRNHVPGGGDRGACRCICLRWLAVALGYLWG